MKKLEKVKIRKLKPKKNLFMNKRESVDNKILPTFIPKIDKIKYENKLISIKQTQEIKDNIIKLSNI